MNTPIRWLAIMVLLLQSVVAWSQPSADPTIKIAVLKYGTVNWELSTLADQGLDRQHGFQLEVLPLASMTATRTALKSGAVDVIVADWLWVTRQRDSGDALQFIPYSSSVGKLMLAKNSSIVTLADLRGKKIGIAGGPASKGWLLLRALGLKQGIDLKAETEQQYGASPLLSASLEQDRIDAVVTFWHYAARLEGQGHRALLDLKQVGRQLGMKSELPMLGYVFRQNWAEQNPQLVAALQSASSQTKQRLRQNEVLWTTLRPLMKADVESEYERLKSGYLAGAPIPLTSEQIDDAKRMFELLAKLGGKKLVGNSRALDPVTFWHQP